MKLRHFLADPLSIYVLFGGNDALQNKEKWGKMPFFRVRKVQNKADKCNITPGRRCGRLKSGRSLPRGKKYAKRTQKVTTHSKKFFSFAKSSFFWLFFSSRQIMMWLITLLASFLPLHLSCLSMNSAFTQIFCDGLKYSKLAPDLS